MVAGGGRWRRSAAGARGGPERRRGGRRRRLYGDVDCLAPARFGAGHPGPPAGGRRLRPRPERAKRRILRVALVQRARAARAIRRRGRALAARCVERDRRPRSARGARTTAWTPGSTSPATCASRPARRSTTWASTRSRPPGRSGSRTRCSALTAEEVRERVDSPVFRGGVLVPDFATVQPARLALGLRARLLERGRRDLRELAGASPSQLPVRSTARTRRGVGSREGRGRSRVGPVRALVPPAPLAPVGDLLAHRPHRAGARRDRARSAGPAASASPTAARSSTTSAPRATAGSRSAGAAAGWPTAAA